MSEAVDDVGPTAVKKRKTETRPTLVLEVEPYPEDVFKISSDKAKEKYQQEFEQDTRFWVFNWVDTVVFSPDPESRLFQLTGQAGTGVLVNEFSTVTLENLPFIPTRKECSCC